jgi:hypothetical protein
MPTRPKAKHFALVVKNLKVIGQARPGEGRRRSDIEPLNRFETDFLNTCDQGLRLVKAVDLPSVKLHLDTFHMNIEEKNQAAAILKAGKLLGHFHACGTDRGTPGNDSLELEAHRRGAQDDRLQGRRRHRILHHRRQGHRPRRRHLARASSPAATTSPSRASSTCTVSSVPRRQACAGPLMKLLTSFLALSNT